MSSLTTIADKLRGAASVGIVCHVNPDADTVGSALALWHWSKSQGKDTVVYCQDGIPRHMGVLEGAQEVTADLERLGAMECLVAVDCGDEGRLGGAACYVGQRAAFLNIDHHGTNARFGTENLVEERGATAEILYDLLCHMGWKLTPEAGACLYAGIVTDTGKFCFSNTTPQTLRIAASLMERGIDADRVIEAFYRTNSWERTCLMGACLGTMTRHFDGRVAILTLDLDMLRRCGAQASDSEGLVNYAVDVEGVEIGALIQEKAPGMCKLSLRSRGRWPVDGLAAQFQGGGHRNAAGGNVAGTTADGKAALLAAIQERYHL